jgi:hypothetical protein
VGLGVNRVTWRRGVHPILLLKGICQWLVPRVSSFGRHDPMVPVEFLRRKNVLLGERCYRSFYLWGDSNWCGCLLSLVAWWRGRRVVFALWL